MKKNLKKTLRFIAAKILYLVIISILCTSCTKQKACKDYDNYAEGTLVVYGEPYYENETYCTRFFRSGFNYDYKGIRVIGGLPNKYKKMDTVKVGIGYSIQSCPAIIVCPIKIKCIEQIDY